MPYRLRTNSIMITIESRRDNYRQPNDALISLARLFPCICIEIQSALAREKAESESEGGD